MASPQADHYYQFILADSIGTKGGSGSVYKLSPKSAPPLVAKLYNDVILARIRADKKFAQRIVVMAYHRAELATSLPFATWPRRLLLKERDPADIQQSLLGFSMEQLVGTTSLNDLISLENARLKVTPQVTAHIAITLADQVDKLHNHPWGFVFGDMSPNNIHVTHDFRHVRFIDTDSFQFDYNNGAFTFALFGLTSGFKSPGAQKALEATGRVPALHDDFVLAILIFFLLMADTGVTQHPFQSGGHSEDHLIEKRAFPFDNPAVYPIPPVIVAAYQSIPDAVRAAFTRTFTTANTVTAREWVSVLSSYRRGL